MGHRATQRPRKSKASAEPAAEPTVPPQKQGYDARYGRDPGKRISPERIAAVLDRIFLHPEKRIGSETAQRDAA